MYKFYFSSLSGILPITQLGFTLKYTSDINKLIFTEGLATYNSYELVWSQAQSNDENTSNENDEKEKGGYDIILRNYKTYDAKTGNEIKIDIDVSVKKFHINNNGKFMYLINEDELIDSVEKATISIASKFNEEDAIHRESLMKKFMEESRAETKQSIINEVTLIWNSLVQAWIDVPNNDTTSNYHQEYTTSAGKECVKLDPTLYKKLVEQQIRNTFSLSLATEIPNIEVVAASLTTEFSAILEKSNLHAHIADFTRVNESLFFVEGEQSSSLEIKCSRWVLAWPDVEELSTPAYLTKAYDEFVQIAQNTFKQVTKNLNLGEEESDDSQDDSSEDESDQEKN